MSTDLIADERHERDGRTATEQRRATRTPPPAASEPVLQALDLDGLSAAGMACDIDDPDCNPMAFAGTTGAPAAPAAMTGGTEETR